MTLPIHEGKKAEDFFLKDGTIPDPRFTEKIGFKIVQTITKRQLEGLEADKWNKNVNTCMVVYEDTSAGFHHMYTMEKTVTNH